MLSCSVGRVEGRICLFVRRQAVFEGGESTYVGHSWSSYARTIEKQSRNCREKNSQSRCIVFRIDRKVEKRFRQERGWTYDAMSGDCSVIADTLKLFG
jgi:hypothetical protein